MKIRCYPATIILILLVSSTVSAEEYSDRFTATGYGFASLVINHVNAFYNCVQDSFTYDYMITDGSTLHVWEYEVPSGGYADCVCHFDLSITFFEMTPGPWLIIFNWLEDSTGEWAQELLCVEIPGEGSMFVAIKGPVTQSECTGGTAANDQYNWGHIKSLYR